jgi:hypothetical protein
MSDQAPSPESLEPIEAILASLRVWILDLVAAILDEFGLRGRFGRALAREMRRKLREVQFDVKRAIVLLAMARVARPRALHRFHPPPGYCVRRFKPSALRLVTHGVFKRMRPGHLRTRIARLRDVLENVEVWIARLAKRLTRGFTGAHSILAAPPVARAFRCSALIPAPADSS